MGRAACLLLAALCWGQVAAAQSSAGSPPSRSAIVRVRWNDSDGGQSVQSLHRGSAAAGSTSVSALKWQRPSRLRLAQADVPAETQPAEPMNERMLPAPNPLSPVPTPAEPQPGEAEIIEQGPSFFEEGHDGIVYEPGGEYGEGPIEDYSGDCCEPSCCQPGHGHDLHHGHSWHHGHGCRCPKCCIYWCWWEDLEATAGVTGFKGPVDLGLNGNFGAQNSLNLGVPLFPFLGIGAQVGAQGVYSNFSGNLSTDDNRSQLFVTGGVFHRTTCGIQWGFVYDFLHDEYYVEADLHQARGEISWVCPNGNEIGGFARIGTDEQDFLPVVVESTGAVLPSSTWEPIDHYALFFRRRFCKGGSLRLWAGASDVGDILTGADAMFPLGRFFGLTGGFVYLIPENGREYPIGNLAPAAEAFGTAGYQQEGWAIELNLAFYPGGTIRDLCSGRFRPLLPVANNRSFIVDRRNLVVVP
jgi:hypothetical protein